MSIHFFQARRIYPKGETDYALLFGIAGGRVPWIDPPNSLNREWLYSIRVFFLMWRVEIGILAGTAPFVEEWCERN